MHLNSGQLKLIFLLLQFTGPIMPIMANVEVPFLSPYLLGATAVSVVPPTNQTVIEQDRSSTADNVQSRTTKLDFLEAFPHHGRVVSRLRLAIKRGKDNKDIWHLFDCELEIMLDILHKKYWTK